jgi:hypothetical protein
MDPMAKVMMSIQWPQGQPTLEGIKQLFSLSDDEVDREFGLIEVDPAEHIFTFLVEATSVAKVHPGPGWSVSGPFSNPRIEPFGPPQ